MPSIFSQFLGFLSNQKHTPIFEKWTAAPSNTSHQVAANMFFQALLVTTGRLFNTNLQIFPILGLLSADLKPNYLRPMTILWMD